MPDNEKPVLPDVDKVEVNLNDEILKLAQKDEIKDIKYLDLDVVMTRRDYYKSSVIAYYRGYDEGWAAAAVAASKALDDMQAQVGVARKQVADGKEDHACVVASSVKQARVTFAAGGAVVGALIAVAAMLIPKFFH